VTKIVLEVVSTKASGTMWIDDVSLVHP